MSSIFYNIYLHWVQNNSDYNPHLNMTDINLQKVQHDHSHKNIVLGNQKPITKAHNLWINIFLYCSRMWNLRCNSYRCLVSVRRRFRNGVRLRVCIFWMLIIFCSFMSDILSYFGIEDWRIFYICSHSPKVFY